MIAGFVTYLVAGVLGGIALIASWLLVKLRNTRSSKRGRTSTTVGFFHPYCNSGGGGERVLWVAIRAIQEQYPDVECIVYTGDCDVTGEEIVARAEKRFNIKLVRPVHFVFLKTRVLVEAKLYPYFTLIMQSLGSLILALEAIVKFVPDVYVDSMGYAFTIPLFKFFGGCKVSCYVHYPTISTDMLQRVSERTEAINNRLLISRSPTLTKMKLLYYHCFAFLYSVCGRLANSVMVNSSWTHGHIVELWKIPEKTHLVFPPCDIKEFKSILRAQKPITSEFRIISVAQFRPEKDHPLQIRSLHTLKEKLSSDLWEKVKLILIGSCRNTEDEERVRNLNKLTKSLELEEHVEFKLNISFQDLKDEMEKAVAGIHTMWNEHFGIGVVECMAAGLVTVAHNSGGPKMDIVTPLEGKRTGFLADSESTFADAFLDILNMTPEERFKIQMAARQSSERFSESVFEEKFLKVLSPLL